MNRKRKFWGLMFFIVIILMTSCARTGGRVARDCKYFPAGAKDWWKYNGWITLQGYGSKRTDIDAVITGKQEINMVSCTGQKLVVKGKHMLTGYYEITDKGIFLHRYLSGDNPKPYTFQPPIPMLQLPLISGDVWEMTQGDESFKGKNLGKEYLKTPLGKLLTYKVITTAYKGSNEIISYQIWYAENVGIAKQIIKIDKLSITMTLKSYSVGGKVYPSAKKK